MKPGFTKIILLRRAIFLLLIGMGSAFANPGAQQEEKQAAKAAHREQVAQEQAQRGERQGQHPVAEDRRHAAGQPDGAGTQSPSGVPQRPGRMTPEERRDLRRQINEAGQDIYINAPRR